MTGLMMKYFVLNPTPNNKYGEASRMAINKYAEVIRPVNKKLADELVSWTRSIKVKRIWGVK